MKLSQLLNNVKVLECKADLNTEVNDISISSEKCMNDDLFVCLKGTKFDGHDFANGLKSKASCFLVEKPLNGLPYILVENCRAAYSVICQNFFDNPIKSMKFVAVIGTNGKTSTAHILASILKTNGYNVGVIGTLGHFVNDEKICESLTTPDPYELNKLFKTMQARAVDVVIAEVSAHALYFEKLYGIMADIAILTNITQDHLDFFKTYKEYENTKLSFFTSDHTKLAVLNSDDKATLRTFDIPTITYGLENPSDVFAIDIYPDFDGTQFVVNLFDEILTVKSPLYGVFNVYNLLAAMICARELGINGDGLMKGIKRLKPIDGRFNILKNGKGFIVIDYAHTPDGLENLLRTARTITKSRLITVFGCGGDRDTSKRKIMGKIASDLSDAVVLTSDNPRSENPMQIIHEIAEGVSISLKMIPNRSEAISYALGEMQEGDTVVIAGKGAENYMEIKGKKIPSNDFETVIRKGAKR